MNIPYRRLCEQLMEEEELVAEAIERQIDISEDMGTGRLSPTDHENGTRLLKQWAHIEYEARREINKISKMM